MAQPVVVALGMAGAVPPGIAHQVSRMSARLLVQVGPAVVAVPAVAGMVRRSLRIQAERREGGRVWGGTRAARHLAKKLGSMSYQSSF